MQHLLVITAQTTTLATDEAVELAVAGERARLERYLYASATLLAFTSTSTPLATALGEGTLRVLVKALVECPEEYDANYQSGRLQSGLYGVRVLHDLDAARREVLGDAWSKPATLALDTLLREASSDLVREEVMGSMGLDSDGLESSYVVVDGVERPRTEDDLAEEVTAHEVAADALAIAAELVRGYTVQRCEGSRVGVVGPSDAITYGSQVTCPDCHRTLSVVRDYDTNAWVVPNHAVIIDRP